MRWRRGLLVALLASVAVVAAVVVVPRVTASEPAIVTVMTRNVYLGADISRPVRAARGLTGQRALLAFAQANDAVRATVDQTDFGVRSRLLAAEIAGARPDLVGLQEVALWRTGPPELGAVGPPDATTVELDFLDLLLTELTRAGAPYAVVGVQEEADVEAPALPDPRAFTTRPARDVRLTLRDVILVRTDAGLTVRNHGSGQYRTRLEVVLAGVKFAYIRGFVWADVERDGTRFRFVTTHLESDDRDVTAAQAEELLAGLATATDDPLVVAGDLNSTPDAVAYAVLTAAGLDDAWQPESGPGFTFGLSETVDDEQPSFDRRIDDVLVRGLTPVRGAVTGDEVADRDPATGLWPSDHAGVVTTLRVG